jgi:2-C-methyl-D-erythritol 4-phosphate cytidylyltransferase
MLTAIIVAGGGSQRMGFDKLFALLNGRTVLAHSLAAFEKTESVHDIILVGRAERLGDYEALVRAEVFRKVVAIIPGGARRQDSVQEGLERLTRDCEFVAVHDAARPLVRPEMVEQIYQCAQTHGGAVSGAPVRDTLKRVDAEQRVIDGVDRSNLFAVETPQIFRRDVLEKAYRAIQDAADLEVTDEISAVERIGGKVVLLPNEEPNFKITYSADLSLAEFVLRQREP